ncbi:MAG: tRNA (adenosine(37)-N6)-threonylcarbamoyltransferase complex dimerization subunit type 1 TsaB [Desulfobacterota bacterium]|nr:tRNA (adenosine(37)-N6)-threonylcarbamoyltransferase complex dimerization subunit type 1 TsaB [Thermodesulfobacteriota bacterium]
MYILAVETATTTCSVALASDTSILAEMLLHEQHHSENVIPLIERLVADAVCVRHEIGCIAVDIGPGSFTGLRVGISTAQGLAFALGCPIVGVSSLEILAQQVTAPEASVCPMIEAPRGQVYTCLYKMDPNGRLAMSREPTVARPDVWVRLLSGTVVFTGLGALRYRNLIAASYSGRALFMIPPLAQPRASTLAVIAWEAYREGRACIPELLKPQYIRQPDAVLPYPHTSDLCK